MHTSLNVVFLACLVCSACSDQRSPAPAPKAAASPAPLPAPAEESARFPKAGLTGAAVTPDRLYGKSFLPRGTVAQYRDRKAEYEMFVGKTASPETAAIALSDWRKDLTHPKLVPSFGGYFGEEGGKPVFVFAKGPWLAGVKGLPLDKADAQARLLAVRLN